MSIHPADKWHVILDALMALRNDLNTEQSYPWDNYTGADDDPKTTEEGYRAVLAVAEQFATRELERVDR